MAVAERSDAPSRRWFRVYMTMWVMAAVVAVGYLGSLAWQPELLAPGQPQTAEPEPGLRAAVKALAEVDTMRQTVDTLQKDMGDLKGSVEQRGDTDKTLQSRVAALEERVASLPSSITMSTPANISAAKPKGVEAKEADNPEPKAAEKTEAKAVQKPAEKTQAKAPAKGAPQRTSSAAEDGSKTPIETGSISQPQIVFGEAIVTRAENLYAVQIDTATSLDVLRARWGQLVDRHGSTLATLQPRYIAPAKKGAPYRLLAGPLTTPAAAREMCSELRAQQLASCSTADFAGEPL